MVDREDTDAEDAAWEIATAETLRAQGDLASAVTWYRRAAEHLMDVGEDLRAIEIFKLAAELAALEAAAKPGGPRTTVDASRSLSALFASPPPVTEPTASEPSPSSDRPQEAPPPEARRVRAPGPPPVPLGVSRASPVRAPEGTSSEVSLPFPDDDGPTGRYPATGVSRVVGRRSRGYSPSRAQEVEQLSARLRALPLFSELQPDEVRSLAREVTSVRFEPGEHLFERGGPEGPMFVLTEGHAAVSFVDAPSGLSVAAGDFVGEVAACYGGPRSSTVTALSAVEAVVFAPSLVRSLLRRFEPFRDTLVEVARERVFSALPGSSPFFRRLDPPTAAELYGRFEHAVVLEGEALLVEGEPAAWVTVVAAGELELYGSELGAGHLERARPGDLLGVGAALEDAPAGVTARALRGALVARLPAAAFRALAAQHAVLRDSVRDVGLPGRGIAA